MEYTSARRIIKHLYSANQDLAWRQDICRAGFVPKLEAKLPILQSHRTHLYSDEEEIPQRRGVERIALVGLMKNPLVQECNKLRVTIGINAEIAKLPGIIPGSRRWK